MTDHADVKRLVRRGCARPRSRRACLVSNGFDRLINDVGLLAPSRAQRLESFGLQDYNARGKLERLLRLLASLEITIEISTGERYYNWNSRMVPVNASDRRITAERVQGDQQVKMFSVISLFDAD